MAGESVTPICQMCIDVFGIGWGSFKIAHMSTCDRIGVEMFEFKKTMRNQRILSTGKRAHFTFVCRVQI